MAGILQSQGCYAIQIGGIDDHIHALFGLSRTVTISDTVRTLKSESSKWVKATHHVHDFAWQSGYGAFSISRSHPESVIDYIANQAQHHKNLSFLDEFRSFLRKYDIPFDEQYVWD